MVQKIRGIYRNLAYMNFLKHNPRVYWKLIKGYINVNVFHKHQVRFVEIMLTYGCNARCFFCSCKAINDGKGALLTKEKIFSIIDECADMGVPVISFLGGEPMLVRYLPELIRYTHKRGILPGITSNASLITKEKLDQLFKLGLGFLSVSIHSTDPAEHDDVVKLKNAFTHAIEMLDYAKNLGIAVNISPVFLHATFEKGQDQKIVALAKEHGFRLSINTVVPAVQGDLINGTLMTFDDNKKLESMCQANSFITTHMTNNFFGYGCPIGNCYMGITPYGDILPCFFVPISFGTVWKQPLKEIFQKMVRVPAFRARPKLCLAGEHKEFIHDYMAPIFGVDKSAPMLVENHPKYDPVTSTLRPPVTSLERTRENHILP